MHWVFSISYIVLSLTAFVVNWILNKRYVFVIFLLIGFIYFIISIYASYHKMQFASFLSWMFFYILTYQILRGFYVKQKNMEPIITGYSNYDIRTNRKIIYSDYIFTVLILIIPALLSFILDKIITAYSGNMLII